MIDMTILYIIYGIIYLGIGLILAKYTFKFLNIVMLWSSASLEDKRVPIDYTKTLLDREGIFMFYMFAWPFVIPIWFIFLPAIGIIRRIVDWVINL